jgi:hypothetical protein
MSDRPTKPPLTIYVAWHPKFDQDQAIADALQDHYRRNLVVNVADGAGLSVINRSTPEPDGKVPIAIDLVDEATAAVVVLLAQYVKDDPDRVAYMPGAATNRKWALVRGFWPSRKFTDEELIPSGGAVSIDDDGTGPTSLAVRAKPELLKGIFDVRCRQR